MLRGKLFAQPGCGAGELPAQSLLAAVSEGSYDICKEISFGYLRSDPKKNRDGFDCVHRQIWGLGEDSPILGSCMSE